MGGFHGIMITIGFDKYSILSLCYLIHDTLSVEPIFFHDLLLNTSYVCQLVKTYIMHTLCNLLCGKMKSSFEYFVNI